MDPQNRVLGQAEIQQQSAPVSIEAAALDDLELEEFCAAMLRCLQQLSAEDFTRFSVVHHLEDHTGQMRRALA